MARFENETIHLERLEVACIIGVHPHERERPQPLLVWLAFPWDFSRAASGEALENTVDYAAVAGAVRDFAVAGKFRLLETLARGLAQHLGERFGLESLELRLQKPQALEGAEGAGVRLVWRRDGAGMDRGAGS